MLDPRTLALALAVFCATFAGGWWLGIGDLMSGTRASWARPAVEPTAAPNQPPASPASQPTLPARPVQVAAKPPSGKGLTDEDRLRKPVLILAKAYHKPACGEDIKSLYVRAATSYAEVLMRAAGCHNFPKCGLSMDGLERVWQANRSALDREVGDAMASVHKAGGLSEMSFRGDVGRAVKVIAGAEFHSGPAPACVESNSRSGSRRFRIRR